MLKKKTYFDKQQFNNNINTVVIYFFTSRSFWYAVMVLRGRKRKRWIVWQHEYNGMWGKVNGVSDSTVGEFGT